MLLMHYIKGVMESLHVKIEKKECMKGIIILELKNLILDVSNGEQGNYLAVF